MPSGVELLVLRARIADEPDPGAAPGTVLVAKKRLVVRAGDAALELLEPWVERIPHPVADALMGLGLAAFECGDLAAAEEQIRAALALHGIGV